MTEIIHDAVDRLPERLFTVLQSIHGIYQHNVYWFFQMAQLQPVHLIGCEETLRNIDSGFHYEMGFEFVQRYLGEVQFDVTCLGCCYNFLVTDRRYTPMTGVERVQFSNNVLRVSCFVRKSRRRGRDKGQIVTENDRELGEPSEMVLSRGCSYQLYNPTGVVAVGTVNHARIERIAIDSATKILLSDVYMNYADAALMELYRAQMNLPSLEGICTLISDITRAQGREDLRKLEAEREVESNLNIRDLQVQAPEQQTF